MRASGLTWIVSCVLGLGTPFSSANRFLSKRALITGASILLASLTSCLTLRHSGRYQAMMRRSANGCLRKARTALKLSRV